MSHRDEFIGRQRHFTESIRLRPIASSLIPGGAHTYSKGDDQFPQLAPGFIQRGLGARVWDVDGNEYVDWGMGLRSVVLGHAYPEVIQEVVPWLGRGSNFTRPSPLEAELAQELVDLIPAAEMVKFCKNGSDATTAAVKLSRACTGREVVLRCQDQPFFSIDDWFLGDTVCDAGIPARVRQLTQRFGYNDLPSLRNAFQRQPGQVAAVILEAASTVEPQPGFLEGVKALCQAEGAVLIFDEMITGFRWDLRGAQYLYGVTPDLATFGKAFGNGFSVGALVGRRDIMRLGGLDHDRERVFLLSTTHGGETHALAAAKATLGVLKRRGGTGHLWAIGRQLMDGFNQLSRQAGLQDQIRMEGLSCSPYLVFLDPDGQTSLPLRTLFLQEVMPRGILIPYIAPSLSHTAEEVDLTLAACAEALAAVGAAIRDGQVRERVVGPVCKPVFRKWNAG